MPLSNFRFATEDEENPSINDTDISNINIPKIRAWHPSDKVLDNIKAQQSAFSNTTATPPVSSSMPDLKQQDNLPAAMAKPSFGEFVKNLGKDKQSALGQAALAAGFSLMSTPPSRYPISFGQQIGQAGMAGMQQYTSAMQNAREIEMQNKLFGLKEREMAAKEPYYVAQTEALKMGKEDRPTKLQIFNAAQTRIKTLAKLFVPEGSGNALSLLAEDTDNYFANLQKQPELLKAIERNLKNSKDPYAWAEWRKLQQIGYEFFDISPEKKEGGEEYLFHSGDDFVGPPAPATPAMTPGVFRKAISGAGQILKKSALEIAGDLERRKERHLAEKGIKKENQISLPSGITTTTEAIKYLQEQGMSSEEAADWLRSQ